MDKNSTNTNRRLDNRLSRNQYYSVQFKQSNLCTTYQFKIWNISTEGMCILARHDSIVMNHLNAGDILDMEYFSEKRGGPVDQVKTKIKHITKNEQGRFKGHYLVSLETLV